MNSKNSKYYTYYIGDPDGRLPRVLARVLADFRARHGGLPASLVVNKTLADGVGEALADLVPELEVVVNGGCLATEVWAEVAEDEA